MEQLQNFGFRHRAGVIMAVSSLPGQYGIGTFGKEAFDFIDFLSATGHKCWQVLPLNPTSYGDSPYQSPASSAGNPYFIDPERLVERGLLKTEELSSYRNVSTRVDYGWLFGARYEMLRLAYSRFMPNDAYGKFLAREADWLEDYALFMALKVRYNYCGWTAWAAEHRDYHRALEYKGEFETEMGFWRWCQYEFSLQWAAVRQYAHEKHIEIIGDIPIYVAHDSVDVWAAPEQFLLDENFNPTVISGCPPDGFSPDGQLWGNPIYNWHLMAEQGYAWWLKRLRAAFDRYDILRIDHFRGFAGYYNVPYGESTAKNGKWDSAPGTDLFRRMREVYPDAKIIAEDLGYITPDVLELMKDTGFPGMKMLHFAFYDEDSDNLPRMFTTDNCVVYSASHDSDCSATWVQEIQGEARERFNEECPPVEGQHRVYDLIEFAFRSRANLAMVPLQDYLLLPNEEGRMNIPATAAGNWSWRVNPDYDTPALREKVSALLWKNERNQ